MIKFEVTKETPRELIPYVKVDSLLSALSEMRDYLRSEVKYGEHSDDAHSAYAKAKEKLWDILQEEGINDLF